MYLFAFARVRLEIHGPEQRGGNLHAVRRQAQLLLRHLLSLYLLLVHQARVQETQYQYEHKTEEQDENESAEIPGGSVPPAEHTRYSRGPGAHVFGRHVTHRQAAVFRDDAGGPAVEREDAGPAVQGEEPVLYHRGDGIVT